MMMKMKRANTLTPFKPIGAPNGPDKVTGLASYAADVHLPKTLWGKDRKSVV